MKGILVNIFGGIAKCDLIAEALVKAGREVGFKVPVVVRLEGNEVEKARRDSSEGRDRTADAEDRPGPDRRRQAGGRVEQVESIGEEPPMSRPMTFRSVFAAAIVTGLSASLAGCGGKSTTRDSKDNPLPRAGLTQLRAGDDAKGHQSGASGIPPGKVSLDSGVGKQVVAFIKSISAGTAKADRLSDRIRPGDRPPGGISRR